MINRIYMTDYWCKATKQSYIRLKFGKFGMDFHRSPNPEFSKTEKSWKRYLTIFKFDKELKRMLENNEINLKISVLSHNLNKTLSKLSGSELPSITSSQIAKNLISKNNNEIENLEKIINIFD